MQPAISFPLECHPSSPAIARAQAAALVEPWASPEFLENLALLVSELVTNAVLHGAATIHLDICSPSPLAVRVEVMDGSFDLPVVQPVDLDRASGRGLRLVETLATDWGARRQVNGKIVWFELHEDPQQSRDRSSTRSGALTENEENQDVASEPRGSP